MNKNPQIEKAISCCGNSQTELARRMGGSTRQGHVYQWLNGLKAVSAESAVLIEKATDGEVTRLDLRPDLFGEIDTAVAS